MIHIIDKERELTEDNYPLSILFNDNKDIVMLHTTTKITIGCADKQWILYANELLIILNEQKIIEPT